MYRRPANDNAYDPSDPEYEHEWDSPWHIDLLLMTAGFDPGLIPQDRRKLAFEIAALWQNDIFDRNEIEETLGEGEGNIRKAMKALRKAARRDAKIR